MTIHQRVTAQLERLNTLHGVPMTISRGTGPDQIATESPVLVTVGKTNVNQVVSDDGKSIRTSHRDHILPADSYVLGGEVKEPLHGDVFMTANNKRFVVRAMDGEPSWRFVDQTGESFIRCHVSEESA